MVFKVPAGNEVAGLLLKSYLGELEDMLGVGYARMETGGTAAPKEGEAKGLGVEVEVLDGREKYQRCARCWKRRPDVGSDKDYPDLSARDAVAVKAKRGNA